MHLKGEADREKALGITHDYQMSELNRLKQRVGKTLILPICSIDLVRWVCYHPAKEAGCQH